MRVRSLPKAITATLGVQAIIIMASLVVPLTAAGVALRLFGTRAWPDLVIYAIAFLFGASGSSWNGLALSEAAHFAPTGHVGEATAGVMFFIYTGALIGPALFSLATSITGTVTIAFLLLGPLALRRAWWSSCWVFPTSRGFWLLIARTGISARPRSTS